jgi:hypothetical protein
MAQDEIEAFSLLQRLSKIEKTNRYWRLATLFLLLILASSVTSNLRSQGRIEPLPNPHDGFTPPDLRAQTVRSERFQLMDQGAVRGQVYMRDGAPVIELYDAAGNVTWSTSVRFKSALNRNTKGSAAAPRL